MSKETDRDYIKGTIDFGQEKYEFYAKTQDELKEKRKQIYAQLTQPEK